MRGKERGEQRCAESESGREVLVDASVLYSEKGGGCGVAQAHSLHAVRYGVSVARSHSALSAEGPQQLIRARQSRASRVRRWGKRVVDGGWRCQSRWSDSDWGAETRGPKDINTLKRRIIQAHREQSSRCSLCIFRCYHFSISRSSLGCVRLGAISLLLRSQAMSRDSASLCLELRHSRCRCSTLCRHQSLSASADHIVDVQGQLTPRPHGHRNWAHMSAPHVGAVNFAPKCVMPGACTDSTSHVLTFRYKMSNDYSFVCMLSATFSSYISSQND